MSELGRHTEAEKAEAEVLELRKEVLGLKHPGTIRAMANLACTKYDLCLSAEAEEEEILLLELRTNIIGTSHPDTTLAMKNLAKTWYEQRKRD